MNAPKKIALPLRSKIVDALFYVMAVPAAYILRAYRRRGSQNFPLTTPALKRIGLFPVIAHYYQPLFDDSTLTKPLSDDRDLPGIDLNLPRQLDFLRNLTFTTEIIGLKWDGPPTTVGDFALRNPTFGAGDAEFLYQFVRALRPGKIVEIGSGNSTKIARLALRQNERETGVRAVHTCIEPYEMSWLENMDGITVVRKRVEDCGLDWARELSAGDVLFVDSSHMIRPQGDVLKEYLEIFPQLGSGVYIHIHDIFTPKDYPSTWVVDEVQFWNEQYLLEALLSNTDRYEVIAALNYLKHHQYPELHAVCPYMTPEQEPGSFYLRVR